MSIAIDYLSSDTSAVALILSPPVRRFLDCIAGIIKEEVLIELENSRNKNFLQ